MRSHAEMEGHLAEPTDALVKIEGILRDLARHYAPALPKQDQKCCWEALFALARADARTEFLDVWEEAQFTLAEDPFPNVARLAKAYPVKPQGGFQRKRCVEEGSRSDYSFFISFAAHLQRICEDRNIMLPCQKLAEEMGVSAQTISRYRRHAKADGFLTEVRPYTRRPSGEGDATEFRFDLNSINFPASLDRNRDATIIMYGTDGKVIR